MPEPSSPSNPSLVLMSVPCSLPRFQPDPLIRTRAVFMLDDDLFFPCADLERGLTQWRQNPHQLTGYYPRMLERHEGAPCLHVSVGVHPPTQPSTDSANACSITPYQHPLLAAQGCEALTLKRGRFNIILAGACFMDQRAVFPMYFSDRNEAGRRYVDRVFNCDDLLLNFMWANHIGEMAQQARL